MAAVLIDGQSHDGGCLRFRKVLTLNPAWRMSLPIDKPMYITDAGTDVSTVSPLGARKLHKLRPFIRERVRRRCEVAPFLLGTETRPGKSARTSIPDSHACSAKLPVAEL